MRQLHRVLTHLTKLCLNLTILAVLGLLGWVGYTLFTQTVTSQTDAIKGTAIFIGGLVGWILIIKFSRHAIYVDTQPSMKVTIFGLLAISIIAGMAGVEPLARYIAYLGNLPMGWLPQLAIIGFLLNPLYVIATIALVIWIIVTIRRR